MKRLAHPTWLFKPAIDLGVLSLAFWLAFFIRFEGEISFTWFKKLMFAWPYVLILQYGLLFFCGVTRLTWRYVSLHEARRIVMATGIATMALTAVRFLAPVVIPYLPHAEYAKIPLGIILIDFAFAFLGLVGVRFTLRVLNEREEAAAGGRPRAEPQPTLLIGAGREGALVSREILNRPEMGIQLEGFLDDNPAKRGETIQGIAVLGTTEELVEVCRAREVRQVLITIANPAADLVRKILKSCEEIGVSVKIIPGLYQIVGGHVNLSSIRKVNIEDLLRREPVNLDSAAIAAAVKGRIVMVTGAGGSVGAELCRQVCRFGPRKLQLVEYAENGLFQIHRELAAAFPGVALEAHLSDIRDAGQMEALFAAQPPAVLFHAAAYKHVPMLEDHPAEAVRNNVLGTRLLADLAHVHGVGEFVMISTDKAVRPSSVMGATKRVAEIYLQSLSQRSQTRFVAVRFGNVLGSSGSVVPIFQEQIAKGGPVTVTHPEMRRYFMTVGEACQLVLQASAMGRGGEIFILDMGEPVRIVDLAQDLIRLSGLRPGQDIEVAFTGVRPGEKLFEQLSVSEEQAETTRHPKIFIGRLKPNDWEQVRVWMLELQAVAAHGKAEPILAKLAEIVPEYRPVPGPEGARAVAGRPNPTR